jgi:hypothetical protein
MNILKAAALAAAISLSIPAVVSAATVSEVATVINGLDSSTSITALESATTVNVLKVSSLEDIGADRTALDEALAAKSQDIAVLQLEIDQNMAAQQALEAQGLTAEGVVGIEAESDGAVTLIVDDMAAISGDLIPSEPADDGGYVAPESLIVD